MTLLQEMMTHFFIGTMMSVLTVTACYYYGKRRTLLRFGGDSPLSLGTKMHWIGYYLVALVFEVVTSFHWGVGARLYAELALSPFQAASLTLGLFLVDRLAMMLVEPQSDWRPGTSGSSGVPPVLPVEVQPLVPREPDVPVVSAPPSVPSVSRDAGNSVWLKNMLKDLVGGVGSLTSSVRQNMAERKKAAEERRQTERTERLRKLDDNLRGH